MKVFSISILAILFFANISIGETVYFLVADEERTESYVLPLSDSNDIAHARDLIEYGPSIGEQIVVAHVACGGDGINRDYMSQTKRAWNWHVTEFDGFADITVEILDAWPSYLLYDCQGWISNTGGSIGFWAYTVVEELGTDPKHWRCDFANDDMINMNDLAVLGQYWLRNDCSTPSWCGGTDLNYNNIVDTTELLLCLGAWLSPYAQSPIWYSAWNCPTQCHGNADCQSERVMMQYYPIGQMDLSIFNNARLTHCGDFSYDPRVDFDRDCDVDTDDQAIMEEWAGVPESQFPADCPTTP